MAEEVSSTELLLTYDDLAVRWGRTRGALYVAKHRGYLPEPDYVIGGKPLWTEATIRRAESQRRRPERKETG